MLIKGYSVNQLTRCSAVGVQKEKLSVLTGMIRIMEKTAGDLVLKDDKDSNW